MSASGFRYPLDGPPASLPDGLVAEIGAVLARYGLPTPTSGDLVEMEQRLLAYVYGEAL